MTVCGDDVVRAARRYIGTPVRANGRNEHSVDCLGLVWLAGVESGALEEPAGEAFEPFRKYRARLPDPAQMVEGLSRFLVPIGFDDRRAGDVGLFTWSSRQPQPTHLAIMARLPSRESIIHADGSIKPKRVVEVTFSGIWAQRLISFWRFPRLA